MNYLSDALSFIFSTTNWSGDQGIAARLFAHLGYTALAVGIALLLSFPLALWLGHIRRGRNAVVAFSSALRALPSLGLLMWLALELSFGIRLPVVPATIVLTILAMPPLITGVVSGLGAIPRSVVESAKASGFSGVQIIAKVELPLAAPTIIGGIRSATVQVLATTTIVAYIGLSGLGRYLIDGLAIRDYTEMLVGALLVTALALVVDLILAGVQRASRPKGI